MTTAIRGGFTITESLAQYYAKRSDANLVSDYGIIARAVALYEEKGPAGLVGPMREHLGIIAAEQAKRPTSPTT